MRFIWRIIVGIFVIVWNLLATIIMTILVMAGMAAAGYYLLDYLVAGEEVTVPSVYGMNKAQAMETLLEHDLWLNPDIEEIYNQNVEPGIIVEQRPQPNERVKKKRSVTVTISAGARELEIPDVKGQYEDEAVLTLRSAGLDVGQRASAYHERIPEKGIIAQDPLPGRQRSYGNQVNLLVSLGSMPQGFVMPNYMEQSIEDVLQQIELQNAIAIKPEVKYIPTPEVSQWNKIIEQRPQPGTRMAFGEKMVFQVGSSGTSSSDIHLIHIEFNYPYGVFNPDNLAVLIWDETSYDLKSPTRISIKQSYPGFNIEHWAPVVGNAYVMLAETTQSHPELIAKIHAENWYAVTQNVQKKIRQPNG